MSKALSKQQNWIISARSLYTSTHTVYWQLRILPTYIRTCGIPAIRTKGPRRHCKIFLHAIDLGLIFLLTVVMFQHNVHYLLSETLSLSLSLSLSLEVG